MYVHWRLNEYYLLYVLVNKEYVTPLEVILIILGCIYCNVFIHYQALLFRLILLITSFGLNTERSE